MKNNRTDLHIALTVLSLILIFDHVSAALSQYNLLYESPREQPMHPRTFFLTASQERKVVNEVLCEGKDCPEFRVVNDFSNFIQERLYSDANFLSTPSQNSCDVIGTLNAANESLEKYRKGENERGRKFYPVAPLLAQIYHVSSIKTRYPWCKMSIMVNMYIPPYLGIPPAPTNNSLSFKRLPKAFHVYVYTFTGGIEYRMLMELESFRSTLDALMLCYNQERFYLATYKGINEVEDRHEIWLEHC
ncbi:uncharacterized protein LOC106471717 [Limulus polyphemus]|uniref:Uncharacterized protein LOC106471717 n=1 Tax=Limulus polyphemus TaxID=6850 RepID=A0ABM1BSH1_LIMPO|nr:uncharacterized protein LOC106471717 [Limulus polyphemus]